MTENTPLYSSRIIKSYVEYLERYLPHVDITALLQHADIETYQLDDEGHWLTQKQCDRFNEILVRTTQDPDISKKVGRFSAMSRATGALGQYLLGFIKPETAYTVMENIRSCSLINHAFANGIIPLTVKRFRMMTKRLHFSIGNLYAFRIMAYV